ncbi:hypothetical protein G7B40_003410 [Aetokthonos hydrillicola Thurmond2011]|jgi:hypothetical protein|uniref:Inactive STAND domain-containing protein n=1 Tax=Aetokthonos hydrillicola Thurmond2011 TaxID=2712845 RepID=A0AAP5M3C4_9CYAN|nr:hypothetical protein [Aetokthonos hydrillicola]MBO3462313.1 hypothetical protein [Aetokthonos hydrillicola CCALA 1050]MBW4590824.1 hypothetical protein [Aetokthonos hydrillicola CCALA 1050]MDR9893631.1 hypothetical protein [Aetokthonos hydrillicola Thurmond2011]
MPSVQYSHQRQQELQKYYTELTEKINHLRTKAVIEAGASVHYQLKNELKEAEKERDRVEKQLQAIENERIQTQLFQLNYKDQALLFRKFLEKRRRIGSFLVHGSPEHGQIFLLKRFLQAIPYNSTETYPIEFHLRSKALKTDITAFWRRLGREIGVENLSSPDEIAKGVIVQLQTQHIILVFHDVDCFIEEDLQTLICDFWRRLVNLAKEKLPPDNESFLLMFLVAHDDCASTWKINFANQLDSVWEPHTPIRLPMIECLSDQVLATWIDNAIDILPTTVTEEIDYTVRGILKNTKGVPERVFAEIFNLCGCNWEEEEVRWLEL